MLFNSLHFFVFFVVVYALYLLFSHQWQNRLLIVASCLFYSAWDWRFLLLMFVSITTDYFCSKYIAQSVDSQKRKQLLFLSIVVNLSILGFFKYFNFFVSNLQALVDYIHPSLHLPALKIILPLGISFYTFEAISYTVDVYRGVMKPARKYWDYVLFVIYFPHLVAGPIMRAKDFLPQIISPRALKLDQFYEGCYLIFWGLFEKIFVADNLAKFVDPVFSSPPPYVGSQILAAAYAFAFQIFCDFDGYSNIARGLGKCMGFEITVNFNLPYFAVNPTDFWRRWHISLSSWLRDYLYIPLGGSRGPVFMIYRNLFLTMLLGGLWHGASWTFVIWGAYHGILLIVHRMMSGPLFKIKLFSLPRVFKIFIFFQLTCLGWLIFRAESAAQLNEMLSAIFTSPFQGMAMPSVTNLLFFIFPVVMIQIFQYYKDDLTIVLKWPVIFRALFYFVCFYLILIFGVEGGKQFVYFQF